MVESNKEAGAQLPIYLFQKSPITFPERRESMTTINQKPDLGIVELIRHIKEHPKKNDITYTGFCELIGYYRKDGKPMARDAGRILGIIGKRVLDFDPEAPRITALVVNKKGGPGDGFRAFAPNWDHMSKEEKEGFVSQEKKKIEKYRRAGKFDKLLSAYERKKANDSVEFESLKENGNYSVDVLIRKHRAREYKSRDQSIVREKKKGSGYVCECCNFDFRQTYGEIGDQYIECHHIKPLANIKGGEKVGLKDLAVLCSNCHRMIHKLLAGDKEKYQPNNYAQSIKDLRTMMKKTAGIK